MMRLAIAWLDNVFADVASSARAVGAEYASLISQPTAGGPVDPNGWIARAVTQGGTTGFRTWGTQDEPATQAPYPSLYRYSDTPLTTAVAARLDDLNAMVPVVRSAHASFDFSWVYITTPDELMLIYPYVPIAEALNNKLPTKQVFYTAANVTDRRVGWTEPYFDLVGAGMMVTASSPIFNGDDLIGVASRDVTLKQLSGSVLGQLGRAANGLALLVDGRGLAISASDESLEAEIERVNETASAAVLFYRSPDGLVAVGDGTASANVFVNEIVEQLLTMADHGTDSVREFSFDGRQVLAGQIPTTGWFLVLALEPG